MVEENPRSPACDCARRFPYSIAFRLKNPHFFIDFNSWYAVGEMIRQHCTVQFRHSVLMALLVLYSVGETT